MIILALEEKPACPNDCNKRGGCTTDGKCMCSSGWTGEDCSVKDCIPSCGMNGKCVDDVCDCEPLYRGSQCEIKTCAVEDCSGRGVCDETLEAPECICDDPESFTGADCAT